MEFKFLKIAEYFAELENVNIQERGDATFTIDGNNFKVNRLPLVESDRLINRTKRILSKYQNSILAEFTGDQSDYSEKQAGAKVMGLIETMLSEEDVNNLKYELCASTLIELNGAFVHLKEAVINSKINNRDDLMAVALVYLEVNAAGFFTQRLITSLLSRAQTAA